MDQVSLLFSVLSFIASLIIGFFVRSHLPAYFAEKGRNLASKEDVTQLTDLVERVKAAHSSEMERLKADLQSQEHVTELRRKVYEDTCQALRVFLAGHEEVTEPQERFNAAYSAAWLWASDEVLVALFRFLQLQVQHAGTESVAVHDLQRSYSEVILAMRRDSVRETSMMHADYQFVHF